MIRNGVIEEMKFFTDNVTIISPLRVFQRLTLLRCSPVFPNKSKLSTCRHCKVCRLRSSRLTLLTYRTLRRSKGCH